MKIHILDSSNLTMWFECLEDIRHDVYHTPQYCFHEGRRTGRTAEAMLIEEGTKRLFVPYLIRPCDDIVGIAAIHDGSFDVVSPYGYPGILINEAAECSPRFVNQAFSALQDELRSRGACAAFFRTHPILNHHFAEIFEGGQFLLQGETVSIDLTLSESAMWEATRSGHRRAITKCKKLGMTARMVPFSAYLDEFIAIYVETMERVGAANRYYSFDAEYFRGLHEEIGEALHLCIVESEGEIACAGLYSESCGIVQSAFGGTRNRFVSLSPSVLETDFARTWAKARGNTFLHLGGGVGASHDSVFQFKAGFSKQRFNFFTARLILDEHRYKGLVDARAESLGVASEVLLESDFFPAYRAL